MQWVEKSVGARNLLPWKYNEIKAACNIRWMTSASYLLAFTCFDRTNWPTYNWHNYWILTDLLCSLGVKDQNAIIFLLHHISHLLRHQVKSFSIYNKMTCVSDMCSQWYHPHFFVNAAHSQNLEIFTTWKARAIVYRRRDFLWKSFSFLMTAHVLLLSLINGKKNLPNTLETFLTKAELAQKNFTWDSFVDVKIEQ